MRFSALEGCKKKTYKRDRPSEGDPRAQGRKIPAHGVTHSVGNNIIEIEAFGSETVLEWKSKGVNVLKIGRGTLITTLYKIYRFDI